MIKDITFGQYIPINSCLHKADARIKLLLLILYIVIIFIADNFVSLGLLVLLLALMIWISNVSLLMYLKNLKTILPIFIFTALLNALYVNTGVVLVDWWIITITTGGLIRAAFMALRIFSLILASAVFSYTTLPTDITSAIESLLKPLNFIGLGSAVHTMAMTMTIALRFIPTLIEETDKIMNAQKARGADMESGGLLKRARALIPILIPLLISAVRRAYDLSEAMECRCYNGGKGRTKYKEMRYTRVDFFCLIVFLTFVLSSIISNIIF